MDRHFDFDRGFGFDCYSVIGVQRRASASEVEQAFCAAMAHRPRTQRGRFLAWLAGRSAADIASAYRVLSQPDRRAEYDEQLTEASCPFRIMNC